MLFNKFMQLPCWVRNYSLIITKVRFIWSHLRKLGILASFRSGVDELGFPSVDDAEMFKTNWLSHHFSTVDEKQKSKRSLPTVNTSKLYFIK